MDTIKPPYLRQLIRLRKPQRLQSIALFFKLEIFEVYWQLATGNCFFKARIIAVWTVTHRLEAQAEAYEKAVKGLEP